MFEALFLFASLFGATEVRTKEMVKIATELSAERNPAVYYPELAKTDMESARVKMARLWLAYAFFESSFNQKAMGDHNTSCGLMQVKPKMGYPTCKQMLADPKVAMRAGAMAMEDGIKECGSLMSGLSMYVSGHCRMGKYVAEYRCKKIGGC